MYGIDNELIYEILKSRELSASIRECGEWREDNWPETFLSHSRELQESRLQNLQQLVEATIKVAIVGTVEKHGLSWTEKGCAYPDLEQMDDSIDQVCEALAYDVIDLFTIPALDIVSELGEWIKDLNDFHGDKE